MELTARPRTRSVLSDIEALLADTGKFTARLALDRIFPPEQDECTGEDLEKWVRSGSYMSDPHHFTHPYPEEIPCDCWQIRSRLDLFNCLYNDSTNNAEAVEYSVEYQGEKNVFIKTAWTIPPTTADEWEG